MTKKVCALSVILSCFGLFTSCSTYQADFAQAVATAEVPPNSPTGPWIGRWKSGFNGHQGPLWCIVTPNPDNKKAMDFRYRAGWGKFQFGDYLHTVTVANSEIKTIEVADKMALPGGFGTYSIKGAVNPNTFNATFKAENGDHGTMTLRRPDQP